MPKTDTRNIFEATYHNFINKVKNTKYKFMKLKIEISSFLKLFHFYSLFFNLNLLETMKIQINSLI